MKVEITMKLTLTIKNEERRNAIHEQFKDSRIDRNDVIIETDLPIEMICLNMFHAGVVYGINESVKNVMDS